MTADELRAKFEAVAKGYGYCVDRYPMDGYWTGAYIREGVRELWAFWQAAYASRDAEVEALRKDAERYRWLRKNHNADLLAEDIIDEAIDAAMREDSK